MTRGMHTAIWFTGLAVFLALLSLLSSVLFPFVAGMAVAYFLDPVADRLEKWGVSRTLATVLILATFFVAAVALAIFLFPLLQGQVVGLFTRLPDLIETLRLQAEPLLKQMWADLPPDTLEQLRDTAGSFTSEAVQWILGLLAGLWREGLALFQLLSLVLITPVVAFYLLRDWDLIIARLDDLLPRESAPTIRVQVAEIDRTIAGFVRGQATVCLVLAGFYGVCLTLVELQSGLLVGIGAGLISFIPYVGALAGIAAAMGIALVQFSEWTPSVLVAVIFLVGHAAESYVLTPKLVGGRVGLQPIWIIFALLAGGALFGFTGILLAVPAAAVIGVMVRFAVERYLRSRFYRGEESLRAAPADKDGR